MAKTSRVGVALGRGRSYGGHVTSRSSHGCVPHAPLTWYYIWPLIAEELSYPHCLTAVMSPHRELTQLENVNIMTIA